MVSFVGMTLLHHIAVVRGYARQHSVKTGSLQALKCRMQPFQYTRSTAFIKIVKCRGRPFNLCGIPLS